MNIIKVFDSYKFVHHKAYPKDLQKVYSYFESRGGEYPSTIFFGLQYYLKMLEGKQVTQEKIDEAEEFVANHLGRKDCFNRKGWEYIAKNLNGVLPIRIEAVPEGSNIPVLNCLYTIVNTDNHTPWLTNILETLLSKVWYPTTIATRSFYIRKGIEKLIQKTGGDPDSIVWKCHDFSYRGVSCEEQAFIGAAAHLLSFMGTDTVAGIGMLQKYYEAGMCGFSIPATEHSIMCSFGGREHEIEACENFLNEFPEGLIACVSDSFNLLECVKNIWGGVLREKVLARNGTLVCRPDSGDYMELVPQVLDILWDRFGGTEKNGYKTLDSHVRVIQGDGMNPKTIQELFEKIVSLGWSTDNLVVGSGGGLLQKVDRDTNKFAIKCSSVLRSNNWIDVMKDPITDPGKRSKAGRFQTIKFPDGRIETVDYTYNKPFGENLLRPVFENGKILKTYSLDEVKKNMWG